MTAAGPGAAPSPRRCDSDPASPGAQSPKVSGARCPTGSGPGRARERRGDGAAGPGATSAADSGRGRRGDLRVGKVGGLGDLSRGDAERDVRSGSRVGRTWIHTHVPGRRQLQGRTENFWLRRQQHALAKVRHHMGNRGPGGNTHAEVSLGCPLYHHHHAFHRWYTDGSSLAVERLRWPM